VVNPVPSAPGSVDAAPRRRRKHHRRRPPRIRPQVFRWWHVPLAVLVGVIGVLAAMLISDTFRLSGK
jgi:hypothetical protein